MPIHDCGFIYPLGTTGDCPKCDNPIGGGTAAPAPPASSITSTPATWQQSSWDPPEAAPAPPRLGIRPGLVLTLHGRVEDEPEVSSSLRGCNPTLLLLLLYGLILLLIMLATGSTPRWQALVDALAIALIGGAFILNLLGVWFGRIALGTLAATLDVWGRRHVPLMVMRVNVGDDRPVPVMMANVDHGFKHGDDVVIKGYMTMRGMRASRIRNETTGQRVWDTQPLGNVIILLTLLVFFAMDLAGHLS